LNEAAKMFHGQDPILDGGGKAKELADSTFYWAPCGLRTALSKAPSHSMFQYEEVLH
jgi:hypothetical protein